YRVGEPCVPLTPRTIRSRPRVSSKRRSWSCSTSAYSARSAGSCETFRPDGVTSWRTTRAAASCSTSGSRSRAPCTCSRTTVPAPPGAAAADLAERGEPQLGRAGGTLALPEPLEHELEIRRLDPLLGRRLAENGFDERVLRREPLATQFAIAL